MDKVKRRSQSMMNINVTQEWLENIKATEPAISFENIEALVATRNRVVQQLVESEVEYLKVLTSVIILNSTVSGGSP